MSEQINEQINFGVKGHIQIITRNTQTGEIVDTFEDHNVFLDQGKTELLRGFNEGGIRSVGVNTIIIGDDIGTGSIMEPQPATAELTELDQTPVYTVEPDSEFSYSYPASNTVRYIGSINGATVMDLYPDDPNVVYTSATIRLSDDKAIAYRRFPPRTISALISVDIIWTLTVN